MDSHFLRVIADAERAKWCVRPWCTTCGAQDFRSAVASITDLQKSLESLDLNKLTSHRNWCDMLRLTAADNCSSVDWGRVLIGWLPYAKEHIDFADHVFFYIVTKVYCDKKTTELWEDACIDLALRTKNSSLLETLVRTSDLKSADNERLVEVALVESALSPLLRGAMVKAGFVQSPDEIREVENQKRNGRKLFGAIRRNDMKAFQALMSKNPNLLVKNKEGLMPLDYARAISLDEYAAILEAEINK